MSTLKPNAPTPGPWTVGRERILELIDAGELERVAVNREHAQGLLLRARRHLKTARRLVVVIRKVPIRSSMMLRGWR